MMIIAADTLIAIGLSTISLGTLHEADGVKEHRFCLRNAGTEAVRLVEGYSSCHCTTIVFDKNATILPGDSTFVALRFNPQGKGGDFYESGTVRYESGRCEESGVRKKSITVAMEGTCITSEETLLKQFPVRLSDSAAYPTPDPYPQGGGDSIRLSTDHFDLGFMSVGETKERNVVVLYRNEGDRQECIPLRFTVSEKMDKGLQHIQYLLTKTAEGIPIYITLDVFIR